MTWNTVGRPTLDAVLAGAVVAALWLIVLYTVLGWPTRWPRRSSGDWGAIACEMAAELALKGMWIAVLTPAVFGCGWLVLRHAGVPRPELAAVAAAVTTAAAALWLAYATESAVLVAGAPLVAFPIGALVVNPHTALAVRLLLGLAVVAALASKIFSGGMSK
jgi:hypothetical protein